MLERFFRVAWTNLAYGVPNKWSPWLFLIISSKGESPPHAILGCKWSHTMYTFRRSSFFFLPFLSAPLYSWAVSHYINASQFIHPLPDIYNYRKTQQLNSGTIIPDKWKLVFTQNLYINVDKRFICNKWKLESPQISFNNWMI